MFECVKKIMSKIDVVLVEIDVVEVEVEKLVDCAGCVAEFSKV